jgi:hypothetical protein
MAGGDKDDRSRMEVGVKHEEKILYHQIHPLKLLTDAISGSVALPLLWRHRLREALLVTSVPPILASILIMRYADLEPYKRSPLGRYVERYMTREMQGLRLAGYLIMMAGAWYRRPSLLSPGALAIVFGWARGRLFPGSR